VKWTLQGDQMNKSPEVLESWTRSTAIRAGLAQRARIVLLAGDGVGTNEIVRRVGCRNRP
jgi:hypothetical protein